jgi:hypothetical protein
MRTFYEFLNEMNLSDLQPDDSGVSRSTHKIRKYKKEEDSYYVKFPTPELQSIIEHLSYQIYRLYGIKVPDSHLVVDENKEFIGIATKGVTGDLAMGSSKLVGNKDITDGFFVDALLANWDVMGLNFDNIILSKDSAYRIDPGGTLTFRAQGGRKNHLFGDDPNELDTFKNPQISPQASKVFGDLQKEELERAANIFKTISWNQIEEKILKVNMEAKEKISEINNENKKIQLLSELDQDINEINSKLKNRHAKIVLKIDELL